MIWLGGVQGSGKSTIAQALAIAHDLPVHHVDAFTYAHLDRQAPVPSLDEQLAEGPEAAADWWDAISADRLALVVADVAARGLGDVPALVEGPQLTPSAADELGVEHAARLLVSPQVTSRVRRARAEATGDRASAERVARLGEREAVVTARLREDLARTGRPWLELDDEPDWDAVRRWVTDTLSLADVPRLAEGQELARQRRYENDAVATQVRLWRTSAGLTDPLVLELACACGRSGCTDVWRGTYEEYDASRRSTNGTVSPGST